MKKIFIILMGILPSMMVSCTMEKMTEIDGPVGPDIFAVHQISNNDTKTALSVSDDGIGEILWRPGDQINVFFGTTGTRYVSQNKENSLTAVFKTTDIIGSTESSTKDRIGLYPYDLDAVCDGEYVTTSIPSTQCGVPGTFDTNLFPALAVSSDNELLFYNVCGGIKFSVSRSDIQKIIFSGNKNENLVGKVKLHMDSSNVPAVEFVEGENSISVVPKEGQYFAPDRDYYIVSVPCELSEGFTMTFLSSNQIGKFKYDQKVSIKRSVFSKKEKIDTYATFEDREIVPLESMRMWNLAMLVGQERNLPYCVIPANASIDNIKCTSSNESVAIIKNGKVKAISPGSAVISVSIDEVCFSNAVIDVIDADSPFETLINKMYEHLWDGDWVYGREIYWEQCCGNMMVPGRTRSYPQLFTRNGITGNESPLGEVWGCVDYISMTANSVIKSYLEKKYSNGLTDVQTRSLGEAYFLRALAHFIIAYRYGCKEQGVPAIKFETLASDYDGVYPTQQSSVTDNYSMIIQDLQLAETCLPNYNEYTGDDLRRASKVAAAAMMARVYSHWATWDKSKWNDVISCVDRLESEYGRSLSPSFSELFSDDESNWYGPEYCWAIMGVGDDHHVDGYTYSGNYYGSEFPGVCLENKGWGIYNGWGQFKPTYDALEEFLKDGNSIDPETGKVAINAYGTMVNERLYRTILQYGQEFQYNGVTMRYYSAENLETGFQINKWMEPFSHADFVSQGYVSSSGNYPTAKANFTFIRFADCMLLRAEANLVKGNAAAAAKDLNAIRKRAGLSGNCTGTWEELYHERYCELAFEPVADHASDLKRWAYSGATEIKNIAIKELENHPRALFHVCRGFWGSPVGVGVNPTGSIIVGTEVSPLDGGTVEVRDYEYDAIITNLGDDVPGVGPYEDYKGLEVPWDNHMIVFPYPSYELTKAAGALKQNPGY